MKIPNNKLASKKIIVTTVTIIVVLALVASVMYLASTKKWFFAPSQQKNNKSINYDPPTSEQKNAAGISKKSTDESQGSDQSPAPVQPSSGGGKASVGMTVTAVNQTTDTLLIRTLIQTISSTGTCTLSMTGPNGKVYSASVGVQANPSTSTCQGFNVPLNVLVPGNWHTVIDFEDSSIKATASKDITVQ